MLLKAMDAGKMEEPNEEIWFGFGLIAEQYGVSDAAQRMYGRLQEPKVDYPATSYDIAQHHLLSFQGSVEVPAKVAVR